MTNGDKIRSMTDDELAWWMWTGMIRFRCEVCPLSKDKDIGTEMYCTGKHGSCVLNVRDWLKQESEEEK